MDIYWFTGRSLHDLCSTTQISIAMELTNRNHNVTVINPDAKGTHDSYPWNHQGIVSNARRGFQSRTLGRKMVQWFQIVDVSSNLVVMIDWRVANLLIPFCKKRMIPWMIVDRSPPANKGLLAILQWPSWKKSWKQVRNSERGHGCVVSKMHQQFVQRKIGVSKSSTTILQAGVNLERFHSKQKFPVRTFVYHGKLDKNRGVLALPMLLRKMKSAGFISRMMLIGTGDCLKQLQTIARENEDLEVHSEIEQEKLAEILAQCHVGLLPMPERNVWTLASPLKRSEYAASGMLVLGIDHAGHRFNDHQELRWMKLVQQHDFHHEGTNWLGNMDEDTMAVLGAEARAYAEKNLPWSHTVDALEQAIMSVREKY